MSKIKNAKTPAAKSTRSVGRPKYEVKWPNGKFTFLKLMVENGVDPKTGKGEKCTTLTLRKNMKAELKKKDSVIVRLDALAEPNSENGLGRKGYVFIRRSQLKDSMTVLKTPAAPKKVAATAETADAPADITPAAPVAETAPEVTENSESVTVTAVEVTTPATADVSPETAEYEATKAALLAPETPAPVAETPAETPATPVETVPLAELVS